MVKCADCGFLAIRDIGDSTLVSARSEIRQSLPGEIVLYLTTGGHQSLLECAERAIDMIGEVRSSPEEYSLSQFSVIIHRERSCQQYLQWRPGDSIREHREYKERQQFQDWQTRIEEQRMKFEEDQAQRAEVHHRELLQQARRMHKNELIILGVFVTAAIGLVTVLGSAIEARWIPEWFGLAHWISKWFGLAN
jgi:hypothetical protein